MSGGVDRTEGEVTATASGSDVLGKLANLSELRLDYAFAILMLWQAAGGVLDIRKHAVGLSFVDTHKSKFFRRSLNSWRGFESALDC